MDERRQRLFLLGPPVHDRGSVTALCDALVGQLLTRDHHELRFHDVLGPLPFDTHWMLHGVGRLREERPGCSFLTMWSAIMNVPERALPDDSFP